MGSRFAFTLCNPSTVEIQRIKCNSKTCTFFIAGLEHAPSTGTEHLQGYFETMQRKRLTTAQKIVGCRSHIEFAVANKEENVKYCSKEGNVIIIKEDDQGIFDERDAHYWALLEAAKTMTRVEFARLYPVDYVVRHSVCEKLIASCQTCQEPWNGNLQHKNFWVAGVAGTGKSKWASSNIST
jgi:hypothetical protein